MITQKITFLFKNVTNKGTDICAVNTKKCGLPDTGERKKAKFNGTNDEGGK